MTTASHQSTSLRSSIAGSARDRSAMWSAAVAFVASTHHVLELVGETERETAKRAFCAKRGVLMRAGRLPHACRRLHGYTWRSGKTTSLPQANPPHSRAPAPARAKAPMICTPRPSGRTEGLCAIHPPLPCEQLASSTVDHRYQPYRAGVPVPYPRGGLTPPPLPPARPTVTCIRVRTGDDEPYMPAVGLETTTSPSTSEVYILNG